MATEPAFTEAIKKIADYVHANLPENLKAEPYNLIVSEMEANPEAREGKRGVMLDISGKAAHHVSHMVQGLLRATDDRIEIHKSGKAFAKTSMPDINKTMFISVQEAEEKEITHKLKQLNSVLATEQGAAAFQQVSDVVLKGNRSFTDSNFYPHFTFEEGKLDPGVHIFTNNEAVSNVLSMTGSKDISVEKVEKPKAWRDYNSGKTHFDGVKINADTALAVEKVQDSMGTIESIQSLRARENPVTRVLGM